ncbi:MAG TPA: Ger(x)C family spore germination protein [Firmicutes bacterium]|nr:Ger(x)C family spore germination protein [Candidatus Fermentithermobacillaceae bacterium]
MRSRASSRTAFRMTMVGLLVILTGVAAGGCYGMRELEDLSLITLLGVDKGKTDPILVTAVVAIPRRIRPSAAGGGGGEGKPVVVVSREGKSIVHALQRIDESLARNVTTIETTYVILGEELAREDASCILDVFTRNLEFRHTTLIAVCQGTAQDFLMRLSPAVEADPATYLVGLTTVAYNDLGTSPLVTVHEFVVASTTLESEPFSPYLVTTRKTQERVPPGQGGEKKQGGESEAGQGGSRQESQEGEEVVAVQGAALFRVSGGKIRMVGTLDPKETMAALLMRGELQRGNIEIALPGAPDRQSIIRFHHVSAHPKVKRSGRDIQVTYNVRVTASLDEAQGQFQEVSPQFASAVAKTSTEELRALLERTIEKLKSLRSDSVNLGMSVHTKFATWKEWEEFDWPSQFPETRVSFDIKLFVFTTGFTSRPPVPR